jgi:hypothetical protein
VRSRPRRERGQTRGDVRQGLFGVEPFCGGAAVALKLRAEGCLGPMALSDQLDPRIETYKTFQDPAALARVAL